MAYANTLMFYGWSGDDALHTVNHILSKDKCESLELLLEDKDSILIKLNATVNKKNVIFNIDEFEGGLDSDERVIYLSIGKILKGQSCGDDDIDEKSFSLKELKEFINMSFAIKDFTDFNRKPKLIQLVVSDTK